MAELEEGYGVRMDKSRERLYPVTPIATSTLAPRDTTPAQIPPELLTQMQQGAAQGIDKKFPDVVLERQGQGPKLDRATLDAIRDQYRVEKITPFAASQKGADKDYIAAQEAAYESRANDWIAKYLAEGVAAGPAPGTPEGGSGRGNGIVETGVGILETIPAALKSLVDIVPDLVDMGNYGLRKTIGRAKALPGMAADIAKGDFSGAITRMAAHENIESGKRNIGDDFSQGYRETTRGVKDAFTTDETLKAMEGLGQLMDKDDVTAGEVLSYIGQNPSVVNQIGGDVVGMLIPMIATGGGSAAIRGTAVAQRLAQGGRLARYGGRMLENIPQAGLATAQQTGRSLGGLREQIDAVPLTELLSSPQNQTIYDTYVKQLGLPEKEAERALRDTIYAKAADTTAAAGAVAGAVTLGVGAPLERAAAALPASRAALRSTLQTGGPVAAAGRVATAAGKGAAEETLESLPQNIGANIAENQYTGRDDPLSRGIAANAALEAVAGGAVGAGLQRSRKPAATAPTTEQGSESDTTSPDGNVAATAMPAATPSPDAVGPGMDEAEHKKALKAVVASAKTAKDVKDVLKTVSTPEDFIGGVRTFLEDEMPDEWAAMNAAQRLAATETAAGEFVRGAKDDAVRTGVTTKLAEERAALSAQTVTPAASTNTQPVEQTATAQTEPTATPAAATEAPKQKPLKKAKADKPVEAVATARADDNEVIKLGEPIPNERPLVPKPAKPAESTTPAQQTQSEPKLPAELAKAAPTYGLVKLQFDSDIDRAAYGSTGKSGAKYTAWLKQAGFSDAGIASLREKIKAKLKAGVKDNQKAGNVRITTTYKDATPAKAEPVVAKPAEAQKAKPLKKDTRTPETKKADDDAVARMDKRTAEAEARAQEEAEAASKATKKAKPLKKNRATQEAENEAKAQDEASKAKSLRKGGTKPPKEPAPASEPGQTASAAPTTNTVATARETPEKAVERIAPELEGSDRTNVVDGIRIARESGDMAELNQALRDLGDTMDADAKRSLREQARQTTPKEEGLTTTEVEPEVEAAAATNAKARIATKLAKLWADAVRDGTPASEVLWQIRNEKETLPHEKWLIEKLIPIIDTLNPKLSVFTDEEINAAIDADKQLPHGQYNWLTNEIKLNIDATSDVAAHEFLHAATSAILKAEPSTPEIAKFQKDMEALLADVKDWLIDNKIDSPSLQAKLAHKHGPLSNTREMLSYGLTDYEFTDLLRQIPSKRNTDISMWQRFKDMLADLYGVKAKFRSAFDDLVDTSSGILSAVTADGGLLTAARSQLIRRRIGGIDRAAVISAPSTNAKTHVTRTPIFLLDRVWEIFANSSLGIERAMQLVMREGGKLTNANNPYLAWRRFTSHVNETRKQDNSEVVEPIANWLTQNMARFGETDPETFRQNLDKFLQNYHSLFERNPTIWAESVKLKDGKEVKRTLIIRRAKEGKISGAEMNKQLISLANQSAAVPQDEWTKANAARDPDRARKALSDLAKKGYTTANLTDLNALLDELRSRKRMRMERAGIITPKDPFSDRGWKWYVPLKGNIDASEKYADYDIGSSRGTAKAFRNANQQVMKGRSSNASNSLEQMAVDMNNAATHEAETKFKEVLYRFATQNKKVLGTAVRVWEGTPKSGYTSTDVWAKGHPPRLKTGKNKKASYFKGELPNPEDGFVYNDGDTHYEVRFPKDSPLLRGIKGRKAEKYVNELEEKHGAVGTGFRAIGYATNTMARLQTTISPIWTLVTAFARDTNALPATVAMEVYDNPVQAAGFFAHYTKNLGKNVLASPANWRAELAIILGDEKTLATYADKHPDSFPARVLEYRKAGGSTEYAQGFNRETAGDALFGKLRNKQGSPLRKSLRTAREAVDKVNEVTGNWAQLLELKARVAAYEALKTNGLDAPTAAATVKGALDFGQSGEIGKLVNAMHAFYRVSATAADTLRRITTNKEGFFDGKKTAAWGSFMAGVGYAQYMLLAAVLGWDEEDLDEDGNPKPRINKFDINTLTNNILIPDGKGGVVPYRIGLGLPQLMAAPGIIAGHLQNGAITPKEAADAYYDVFTRNYPAIQPEGWAKDTGPAGFISSWSKALLPSAVKPFTQSADNVSRFDTPIHTTFPRKDRPASAQGMPETAPEFKEMAKTLYEKYGIDMYPETIRHFSSAYGGQPVRHVVQMTVERENREQQGIEMPLTRTASGTGISDEKFYYRKEARKVADILGAASLQYKYHEEEDEDKGRQWMRENPGAVKRKAAATQLDSARDAYYERLKKIRNNNLLSPEGKQLERKKADSALRQAVQTAQKVIDATEPE